MRVLTSEDAGLWTNGTALVALVALAWAIFAPIGLFWTAILTAGLIGAAFTTAVLVRSRSIPSLADVVASAGGAPVGPPARGASTGGSGLRPKGAGKS